MGRNTILNLRQFSDGHQLVGHVLRRVERDPTEIYVQHEMAAVEARLEVLGYSRTETAAQLLRVRAAARRTLRDVTCKFQADALLGAADDELLACARRIPVRTGWGSYVIGMACAVNPRILERGAEVGIIPILRDRSNRAEQLATWMHAGYDDRVQGAKRGRAQKFDEMGHVQGLFAYCNFALVRLKENREHGMHVTFQLDDHTFVIADIGNGTVGDLVLVDRGFEGMQRVKSLPGGALYLAKLPVVNRPPAGELTDANCPQFC